MASVWKPTKEPLQGWNAAHFVLNRPLDGARPERPAARPSAFSGWSAPAMLARSGIDGLAVGRKARTRTDEGAILPWPFRLEGSDDSFHPTPRVHHAAGRCGGVAAGSASAAAGDRVARPRVRARPRISAWSPSGRD